MRICDLKNKEVINSCDCKILGFVTDVDIDVYTGKLNAIIVPGPCKVFGFLGRENEYIIPYDCICKISKSNYKKYSKYLMLKRDMNE